MLDLQLLRTSPQFDTDPRAPTRIAMVHLGFRSVSVRRGISRQRFAAHFPALGLLNLAHSLRVDSAAGLTFAAGIAYFDEAAYDDITQLHAAMEGWLAPARRRIVASSTYTSTIDQLEDFLRRFDPRRYLIVCGGAHASLAPDLSACHLVVRGEGRLAMRHILEHFLDDGFGEGAGAKGLSYRIDDVPRLTTPAFDRSIEELPSPCFAYDLLPSEDRSLYATNFTRWLGTYPQIYVCTQSCRARCSFCSTYIIHGQLVARPVERIAKDLDYLVNRRGHDSLEFHDDDLMQHPQIEELLAYLATLCVPWFCYARVDVIDDALAARLAKSGCRRVFLGIESMNQRNLDYFRKETTVEGNRRAAAALAGVGIGVVAGFIIGAPMDTVESVLAELDEFLSLPLFAINCSVLSPDPGTAEFQRARKRGGEFAIAFGGAGKGKCLRVMPDVERFGLGAPIGLPTVCEGISKADLNSLVILIDASFYFRDHIWNGLTDGRSPSQQAVVGDYYKYILDTLEQTDLARSHPTLGRRIRSALAVGRMGPWAGADSEQTA